MANLSSESIRLLGALQKDARATNRELAGLIGVAESTCLDRVRRLERAGVLVGYHARVSLPSIGRPLQAMVAMKVRPPNRDVIEAFRGYLLSLPEVIQLFTMAGPDDFLAFVAVRDTEHLQSLVLDELTKRRELSDVRTSLVYSRSERFQIEPM